MRRASSHPLPQAHTVRHATASTDFGYESRSLSHHHHSTHSPPNHQTGRHCADEHTRKRKARNGELSHGPALRADDQRGWVGENRKSVDARHHPDGVHPCALGVHQVPDHSLVVAGARGCPGLLEDCVDDEVTACVGRILISLDDQTVDLARLAREVVLLAPAESRQNLGRVRILGRGRGVGSMLSHKGSSLAQGENGGKGGGSKEGGMTPGDPRRIL